MQNKNIFPKFDLFPRLSRVGRFIGDLLTMFPEKGYSPTHHVVPFEDEPTQEMSLDEIEAMAHDLFDKRDYQPPHSPSGQPDSWVGLDYYDGDVDSLQGTLFERDGS